MHGPHIFPPFSPYYSSSTEKNEWNVAVLKGSGPVLQRLSSLTTPTYFLLAEKKAAKKVEAAELMVKEAAEVGAQASALPFTRMANSDYLELMAMFPIRNEDHLAEPEDAVGAAELKAKEAHAELEAKETAVALPSTRMANSDYLELMAMFPIRNKDHLAEPEDAVGADELKAKEAHAELKTKEAEGLRQSHLGVTEVGRSDVLDPMEAVDSPLISMHAEGGHFLHHIGTGSSIGDFDQQVSGCWYCVK